MTIHSIVIQKLLSTNAHLGRRVAAHHFKVYICGSRNGIAILDSDKTLICLRNACHFIGSPIRQKGRSFFVNTNSLFDEIIEQMATRIGCINDSQWRIGGFLTNCSSPKKIRSRNKKINFGSNQQPDCVVIFDADRKSSVILEADRLQIPIASLVDSNIPLGSYKRITYPIPANDPIQFVYLFRNSITKTVLLERGRIVAMKETVGEEKAHRPELLQALLDKGGLTNERKMELVPHPGIKPHFLATNLFRRPFIRGFRSTPYYPSPFELLEAVAPFLNAVSTWAGSSGANGVSGVTDGNVGANSLPGAEVIPSSGTTSTGIPPLLSRQIPKGGHGHLASIFFDKDLVPDRSSLPEQSGKVVTTEPQVDHSSTATPGASAAHNCFEGWVESDRTRQLKDFFQTEQDLWGAPQLPRASSPPGNSEELFEAFISQGTGASSSKAEEALKELELPPVDEGPSSQTEDTDRQFDNPLISDLQRREELDLRLSAHVNAGNAGHISYLNKRALLHKQMLVEKEVEALLRKKGYSPTSIYSHRNQIRGYVLYPYGYPVTIKRLVGYLKKLRMAPEKSPLYRRVLRAIQKGELNLSKD